MLPASYHDSQKHKKGCDAAVWSDGNPSKDYCTNTGQYQDISGNRARLQWWKACCNWDGSKCVPKPGNYQIHIVCAFLFQYIL